jgi:Protein of unknown function (DUF1800)
MSLTRREFLKSSTTMLIGLRLCACSSGGGSVDSDNATESPESYQDPFHALNRITFGVRSDDIEHAGALGIEGYIDEQLNPNDIDDSSVESFIADNFSTINMSMSEIYAQNSETVAQNSETIVNDLRKATLYRMIHSSRQLFEIMVDFWTNHFNVYHLDGTVHLEKTVDDREVIRTHALGKFRDILEASAASPAMLHYLDNYANIKGTPSENFSRELMELHTIGVEAGYSEEDVREVARCFTGWDIGPDQLFYFSSALHDTDEKQVLGHTIPSGQGIEDGQQVLDILAGHEATPYLLASKLARRFISDDPPDSVINAVANSYIATDGDIKEMMRTLLSSDEFFSSADQKLKRPIEFMVSALRASNASVTNDGLNTLILALEGTGQIPFLRESPDGYPDIMDYWGSTNTMLKYWEYGIGLSESSLEGLSLNVDDLTNGATDPSDIVDNLTTNLLHRELLDEDRQILIDTMSNGENAQEIVAHLFLSRYFLMR